MLRLLPLLVTLVASAGCTTYKLWTEYGGGKEEGVIQLSYEYRRFENPQVDERAGIETARERCRDWGFKNAQRKGEDRVCIDGVQNDCSKWRVIREYRCLTTP
jgi:hypothetical protein